MKTNKNCFPLAALIAAASLCATSTDATSVSRVDARESIGSEANILAVPVADSAFFDSSTFIATNANAAPSPFDVKIERVQFVGVVPLQPFQDARRALGALRPIDRTRGTGASAQNDSGVRRAARPVSDSNAADETPSAVGNVSIASADEKANDAPILEPTVQAEPVAQDAAQNADAQAAPVEQNAAPTDAPADAQNADAAQSAPTDADPNAQSLAPSAEDAPDAPVSLPKVDVAKEQETAASEESAKPAEPEVRPAVESVENIGFEDAQKATLQMVDDLQKTLQARGGAQLYEKWRAYNAGIRRQTKALESGSELNGRCRLSWYEKLYADPLRSVGEVEYYSAAWGKFFFGTNEDVVSGVRLARAKMDVSTRGDREKRRTPTNSNEALERVKNAVVDAASSHARAIAPMSKEDVAAVAKESHSIFCGQVQTGHTVPSRGRAKYLVDAMRKINMGAMYDAGESLLSALDEDVLDQLGKIDWNSIEKVVVSGREVGRLATEAGDVLIGGRDRDVWKLDEFSQVCGVIDLGGDDVYQEGSCVANRPVLLIIDLGGGNDEYVGKNPAVQGGAILGASVWFDDGGNDRYLAKDISQGSAIGGFGCLINAGGNDRYLGFLRAQGTALCGFGALIDKAGSDDYRAALFAQGLGAPGGFGVIADKNGDDHYYVGGYYFDSYPEHPGYDGWGQGVGAGIRRVACGGIGALLDGGGDDAYEYDYFGHGGGYWMGIGFARDFGGNDVRYAATSRMYDGSPRREARWQRFGGGFGCHYAVGYLFDDEGNDAYNGTIMGVGMGWDLGAGFLVDFGGNDVFEAVGGLTQGTGGAGSIGAILKYRGDDVYRGNYQGYASGDLQGYHSPYDCGGNYSFVIDHGGNDQYGCRAANNAVTPRGGATGFIVDRPAPGEAKAQPAATANNGRQTQAQGRRPQQPQAQQPQRPSTANGYQTDGGSIKTLVAAPPTVDPTPADMGMQQQQGGGFFGGAGRRFFGGGF